MGGDPKKIQAAEAQGAGYFSPQKAGGVQKLTLILDNPEAVDLAFRLQYSRITFGPVEAQPMIAVSLADQILEAGDQVRAWTAKLDSLIGDLAARQGDIEGTLFGIPERGKE